MGFIIFLVIVGVIFWLIVQRRNNVRAEWLQAANRLKLSYSGGGLVNPHWIYGKKDGLRYDIKTFTRSVSGNASQKWTGYRVQFHRSADFRIRVTESARTLLSNRFQECEIDDKGIFCARPGIETDAPAIIDNVERLQSVAARLLATAEQEEKEEARQSPPPPPIPESTPQPEPETEPGKPETDSASETNAPVSVPGPDPENEISPLGEPAESSPPVPESAQVFELDESGPAVVEIETPVETETETHPETEPSLTLEEVSSDLFDSGRNHFQITQRFDAEYNGLSMLGEGKLVRAEAYSNDRVFGRGPGTLAEVEIHEPEEPLSGHHTIRAVVQLPETASARSLRGNLGDSVTISGTMLRCDAFEGRIFLGAGKIA